jgi:hypothetical protein
LLVAFATPELRFFLEVIIAAVAAAKAPHAVYRLVAIPASPFRLQCQQQAGITRSALPLGGMMWLLVGTRFDHDVLLNFAVGPDGNMRYRGRKLLL